VVGLRPLGVLQSPRADRMPGPPTHSLRMQVEYENSFAVGYQWFRYATLCISHSYMAHCAGASLFTNAAGVEL